MKRVSARAIIIDNGFLVSIFRRKVKDNLVREYYVLPGGGVESGESVRKALVRELKEELNADVLIKEELGSFVSDDRVEYLYLCESLTSSFSIVGEEKEKMSSNNIYEIRKVKYEDLDSIDINYKDVIKKCFLINKNKF